MTSTLFQPTRTTTTAARVTSAAPTAADSEMASWPNEKIRFACAGDSIGLKQLWKLIALNVHKNHNNNSSNNFLEKEERQPVKLQENSQKNNNNNHNTNLRNDNTSNYNNITNQKNEKINLENCENLADFITNRDLLPTSHMSLLKFLAINALELSAPASPALLQQKQVSSTVLFSNQPKEWMQLSGHPESFVPTSSGIVRKRIASLDDSEVRSYQLLSNETEAAQIVPHFYGTLQLNGELFIELQDLLADFKDPCVMDIKMGCRTFLESEVSNKTLRPDLYKKMIAVDPKAPTTDEHQAQAITKLRYMLFREAMSSSHTKGFRIEALRMRGHSPQKDLKTVSSTEQIEHTISQFVGGRRDVVKQLLKRLRLMRTIIERSPFFARHEIVGSSVFIVYDTERVDAWLIDFAKSRELPCDVSVNHRNEWVPGNREEGLLKGLDELIASLERVHVKQGGVRKCLQI